MATKKSKSQIKRIAAQSGEDIPACPGCGVMAGPHMKDCPESQTWTHAEGGQITLPDQYTVVHESEILTLENAATLRLMRFLNAGWGIEARRREGAALIVTKLAFSDKAMETILTEYNKLKDKPVVMNMNYEIHATVKKPKKK